MPGGGGSSGGSSGGSIEEWRNGDLLDWLRDRLGGGDSNQTPPPGQQPPPTTPQFTPSQFRGFRSGSPMPGILANFGNRWGRLR